MLCAVLKEKKRTKKTTCVHVSASLIGYCYFLLHLIGSAILS